MNFVYPFFLWGLFGLLIPIIIHLFQFKRFKTTYFSNVAFLTSVFEDHRAQSNLKRYLLLVTRMLGILFLVLAFAQPYLDSESNERINSSNKWSIFIDNSLSMGGQGRTTQLFEEARQHALRTIQSLPSNTEFQVQDQSFAGSNQLVLNQTEAINRIQELAISPASHLLSEAIERNKTAWKKNENQGINHLVISDFQSKSTDLNRLQLDSADRLFIVPIEPTPAGNAWIDSVWIEEPYLQVGQRVQLHIRAKRSVSFTDSETSVKVIQGKREQSFFAVNWHEELQVDTTIDFTLPTSDKAEITLAMSQAGIPYDDSIFIALNLQQRLNVLEISESDVTSTTEKVFLTDSFFVYKKIHPSQLQRKDIENADFVIYTSSKSLTSGLAQQLISALNEGKNVCYFSHPEHDRVIWNQASSGVAGPVVFNWDTSLQTMAKVDLENSFFQNVFKSNPDQVKWPDFYGTSKVQVPADGFGFTILSTIQNSPLLVRMPIGKGQLFVAGFSLDKSLTNLVDHPIIIPVLFRMALQQSVSNSLYYVIGKNSWIPTNLSPNTENTFTIAGENTSFIPQAIPTPKGWRLEQLQSLTKAGFYSVTTSNKSEWLAFNFNRNESSVDYLNVEALEKLASKSGLKIDILTPSSDKLEQDLSSINELSTLWQVCLLITLLFLTAEVFITRFIA